MTAHDALTPEMQESYAFADERLHDGALGETVRRELVERGLGAEDARTVVAYFEDAKRRRQVSRGRANMLMGAFWSIGGLVATVASYRLGHAGGKYMIAWGAMVFGILQFIHGYNQTSRSSERR